MARVKTEASGKQRDAVFEICAHRAVSRRTTQQQIGGYGTKVEVPPDVLASVLHGRAGQFGNTFTNLIGIFGDYLDPSWI